MSEDSSEKRQREPDPEEVWGEVIKAQEKGRELTQEQLRALEIRKTAILVTDAINQLIEDPTVKGDPIKEGSLVASYCEGMLKLDELGIKKNMHVGDKPDSFDNPTKMAEYAAGQIIGIEGENLPNIRQTLMEAQEQSERKIDSGEASAFLISAKNISPNLKNFTVLRSMVNSTRRFLASDLGQPHNDGTSGTSR